MLGILRKSQAVFYAFSFFWLDGFAVPAPAQVTQTVGLPIAPHYNWLKTFMQNFLAFLSKVTIPVIWLLSVIATLKAGFDPLPISMEINYPYPWAGVIVTIGQITLECIFIFFILRPDRFTWSPYRVGGAFIITYALSFLVYWATPTDQPSYAYIFSIFSSVLSFLLLILFVITIIKSFAKYLSMNKVR